jgi:hypothetical protein
LSVLDRALLSRHVAGNDHPRASPLAKEALLRYDAVMDTHPLTLDRLLAPGRNCLTPDVARHLVDLHASADAQARLDELADKCTAGQRSAEERAEYTTAVAVIEFLSVLQAKASRLLRQTPV